jgi:heterotetrameric sarcosine oxidase gamma subunit
VSEHEFRPAAEAGGAKLAAVAMDIVEIAARRGRTGELAQRFSARGSQLPSMGRMSGGAEGLMVCVRPQRWLLLSARVTAGSRAAAWRDLLEPVATTVDLSSALAALRLDGSSVREVLARGCRIDIDPGVFCAGYAAATQMAQVSTVLAATAPGMLLITPSSTARHFCAWLAMAARPFGFVEQAELAFTTWYGESFS